MARKDSPENQQGRNKNSTSMKAINRGEIVVDRSPVNAPTYLSLARAQKPFRTLLKHCRRANWTWPLSDKIKGQHVNGTMFEWNDRVEKWASLESELVVGPLPEADLPKQWEDHMLALGGLLAGWDVDDTCEQAEQLGLHLDAKKLRGSQTVLSSLFADLANWSTPLAPDRTWSTRLSTAITKLSSTLERLPIELFGDDQKLGFRSLEEARWRCAPGVVIAIPKQKAVHEDEAGKSKNGNHTRRMITKKEAWPSPNPTELLRKVVLRLNQRTGVPKETLYDWARKYDWCLQVSEKKGLKKQAQKKMVLKTLENHDLIR